MASITILCDGAEEKHALDTPVVTLGRGVESEIRLKDIKASRRHCQIVKTPQGYKCLDLSSGNGTFLNGVQIKDQKLNPGDKIQIGSTTITFVDSLSAAKPAAVAGATTKTAAAAPRPVTSKIPTSQLSSAPTKITHRIPISPPSSKSLAKAKPTTQKIGTQKMGSTTRGIGQASASARFHAESRRKKVNPVKVVMVCIGVIFLTVAAVILFAPSSDPDQLKNQIREATTKAAKFASENNFKEAIVWYEKALALVGGSDDYKAERLTLVKTIEELKGIAERFARADADFAVLKKKVEENALPARKLEEEGRKLKDEFGAEVPWAKELVDILGKLDEMIRKDKAKDDEIKHPVKRLAINKQFKIEEGNGVANWGGAIKAWREYLADKRVTEEDRGKAEKDISSFQKRANEDAVVLTKRVRRKIDEKDGDAALAEIEKQRPRFDGTDSLDELDKLRDEIKKP